MLPPPIPSDLHALLAEIGPRWAQNVSAHSQLMVDRFSPILANSPKDGVKVIRDLSYGAHARQRLDVFMPEEGPRPRAALIFVHGGAFTAGERNRSPEIYANVLFYFARYGIVGINMGYRLAPDATFPDASHDVGSVVAWVRDHAEQFGVDPHQIFLLGHSAGAAHAASYAYDSSIHPADGPGLRGLIVASGRVRADSLPENPNAARVAVYYGDPSGYDRCSPVSHVSTDSVATMIAVAEFENPLLDVYCCELAYRLAQLKRRAPPFVRVRGHNHSSLMTHFNTEDERLGREILAFIANPR